MDKAELYPSLYVAKKQKWTFLDTKQFKTTFYDYEYKEWFEVDQLYSILGGAVPGKGGSIRIRLLLQMGSGNY